MQLEENKILHILAIEDDFIEQQKLENNLNKLGHHIVGIAKNDKEALALFQEYRTNIVLMDLHIKGSAKDGVDLAHEFRLISPVPIIFLTASKEDTDFQRIQGTQPYGYLRKPYTLEELQMSIDMASRLLEADERAKQTQKDTAPKNTETKKLPDRFFVKVGNKLQRVNVDEIRWVEVKDDYCGLVVDEKRYYIKMSLKELEGKLPLDKFIRVHRNYIINVDKVTHINMQDSVLIMNGDEVPVTRTYRERLMDKLSML